MHHWLKSNNRRWRGLGSMANKISIDREVVGNDSGCCLETSIAMGFEKGKTQAYDDFTQCASQGWGPCMKTASETSTHEDNQQHVHSAETCSIKQERVFDDDEASPSDAMLEFTHSFFNQPKLYVNESSFDMFSSSETNDCLFDSGIASRHEWTASELDGHVNFQTSLGDGYAVTLNSDLASFGRSCECCSPSAFGVEASRNWHHQTTSHGQVYWVGPQSHSMGENCSQIKEKFDHVGLTPHGLWIHEGEHQHWAQPPTPSNSYTLNQVGFVGKDTASQVYNPVQPQQENHCPQQFTPKLSGNEGRTTLELSDNRFAPYLSDRDMFLVQLKRLGHSYKKIKEMGGFQEAESTLRGRYRTLTKLKEDRVRKPQWQEKDVSLPPKHCTE
ncbi:hypothetical protein BDV25DRAFT_101235 [Aspergillus avenaceus]|uniref:Uncharacterized protein n=1 Tax=Aspergillus avenaceus TaxID=36643 RepID=A0A5N6TXP2_ASPAV|nr:hypothetical protein BDV25DRAFT_101235 [Aspergillus avenaceus]